MNNEQGQMTHDKLLAELVSHKALIVHCSRVGKDDEGVGAVFFPNDMINAIDLCGRQGKELSCSVIWPGHVDTFGDIGIVLKPRSIEAITRICTADAGTSYDPKTGQRQGLGDSFSRQAVDATFAASIGHNEWNICNAETIGLFVKSRTSPLEVAALINIAAVPGYDPCMGNGMIVGSRIVDLRELQKTFQKYPIFTIEDGEIVNAITGSIGSPYS